MINCKMNNWHKKCNANRRNLIEENKNKVKFYPYQLQGVCFSTNLEF